MKYPAREIYEEFRTEMDSEFSDEKNLELFDFILQEHLTPSEIKQLRKRKNFNRLFYEVFDRAIKLDNTFVSARLIFQVFLKKIESIFGSSQAIYLKLKINETIPRFFKNIVLDRHKNFRGVPTGEILKRFRDEFGDLIMPPVEAEIQQALQAEIQKKIDVTKVGLKKLIRYLYQHEKKIQILDSSFILYSLQEDNDSFYKYLAGKKTTTLFLITPSIYDEITLHFEFIDSQFLKFAETIWICKISKQLIIQLNKEIKLDGDLARIRINHERASFWNDLSLVALGTHLVDFERLVVSRDLNLLKILNHFHVPCRNKFP
ncbi:MAG: hypothetical protein ACTSRW_09420 [Candidatus Helarchaeota archaeon]